MEKNFFFHVTWCNYDIISVEVHPEILKKNVWEKLESPFLDDVMFNPKTHMFAPKNGGFQVRNLLSQGSIFRGEVLVSGMVCLTLTIHKATKMGW